MPQGHRYKRDLTSGLTSFEGMCWAIVSVVLSSSIYQLFHVAVLFETNMDAVSMWPLNFQ